MILGLFSGFWSKWSGDRWWDSCRAGGRWDRACPGGSGVSPTRNPEGSQGEVSRRWLDGQIQGSGERAKRSTPRGTFYTVNRGGVTSLPSDTGSLPSSWPGLEVASWQSLEPVLLPFGGLSRGKGGIAVLPGEVVTGNLTVLKKCEPEESPTGEVVGFWAPHHCVPPCPARLLSLLGKALWARRLPGSSVAQRQMHYSGGERWDENTNKKDKWLKTCSFACLFRLIFTRWHFLKCRILEKYERFLFMAPWPARWKLLAVPISRIRSGGK